MRFDTWYHGMNKWGFYAGVRLGRLLAGIGSDGWREFEVGMWFSNRTVSRALCLHLGWIYLLLTWDRALVTEDPL